MPHTPDLLSYDDLIQSRDFSDVEDSPLFLEVLKRLGANAVKNAAAEARAAGLPLVYATEDAIILSYADGRKEILSTAEVGNVSGGKFYVQYPSSTSSLSAK